MGIENLLRPRSVAIVGASDKVGPGLNAWNALRHVGFEGAVHLINPRRDELLGQRSYPSLADIPGHVDAVFVAVGAEAVTEVAKEAAAKGAGALAILSSGFGETGSNGSVAQDELVGIALAHDMAICGPNCLGLLNFAGRTALFGTSLPDRVQRGGVAAVVQSGSIGIALLNSARGLGLSYLVTSGNEAVTASADFIEAFVDDPDVSTIVVFVEQIRRPQAFMAALHRARTAGKPVIVLKSGRSEGGRAAVMAHTGAVAGSAEACDAALAAVGAIQVFSLDELIETALLASETKQRPRTAKFAALSLSGGEIALVLDAAEEVGLAFASPEAPVIECLRGVLPPFAHLANPLDLTWAGLYDPNVARACAEALAGQEDVGTLLLVQDAPHGLGTQQAARYAALLGSVAQGAAKAGKPLVALSNLSDQPHPELDAAARAAGTTYLKGTRPSMTALARYARWATTPLVPALTPPSPWHSEVAASARARLDNGPKGRLFTEGEARAVLASYGVSGPREQLAATADEAVEAALAIGFPVVIKGLVANLVHKSDAGLVRLGLRDTDAVRQTATQVLSAAERLGGQTLGLLVQEQASPIAELFLGARTDPDFGPIVVVGAGGVEVELYRDVAIRLAPIGEAEALVALDTTQVSRLLKGWRGRPRGDIRAVARTISALSVFMSEFRSEISEVELNPLAVFEEGRGCCALDCVIIPNGSHPLQVEDPS